jgi:hypothetical protein
MQQHYFDFEIWRIFENYFKSSGCGFQYFTTFGDGCFLEMRQKDKSSFGAKFNNKIQNFGKFLGTRFTPDTITNINLVGGFGFFKDLHHLEKKNTNETKWDTQFFEIFRNFGEFFKENFILTTQDVRSIFLAV